MYVVEIVIIIELVDDQIKIRDLIIEQQWMTPQLSD